MKRNETTISIVLIVLVVFAFLYYFWISSFRTISNFIYLGFFSVVALFLYLKYKVKKANKTLNNYTIRTIIIILMTVVLTVYLAGFFLGFNRTAFLYTPLGIIKNIYPAIITAVSFEIIRNIVANRSKNKNFLLILLTIYYILFSLALTIKYYSFYNMEQVFKFFCVYFCPVVAKELLYSHLTYKVGLKPVLILRLLLDLYPFMFPIYPDLGEYLESVIAILMPYIIYASTINGIKYVEKEKDSINKVSRKFIYAPIIIFLLIVTILVSGIFKYKMIAVASGSMQPTYDRGDAIIYEKSKAKDIEVGEILAFKYKTLIVTHRVVGKYNSNNTIKFKTKGDANKDNDAFLIPEEDVLGVVKYVVPYIGLPTVWFNEVKNR